MLVKQKQKNICSCPVLYIRTQNMRQHTYMLRSTVTPMIFLGAAAFFHLIYVRAHVLIQAGLVRLRERSGNGQGYYRDTGLLPLTEGGRGGAGPVAGGVSFVSCVQQNDRFMTVFGGV